MSDDKDVARIREQNARWVRRHARELQDVGRWIAECCALYGRWKALSENHSAETRALMDAKARSGEDPHSVDHGFWHSEVESEARQFGIRYPDEFDVFYCVFEAEAGGLLVAAKVLMEAWCNREKPGFDRAEWARKVRVVDWLSFHPASDPALIGAPPSTFAGPPDAPRYQEGDTSIMILLHNGQGSTRENVGLALLYHRRFEEKWELWEACVRAAGVDREDWAAPTGTASPEREQGTAHRGTPRKGHTMIGNQGIGDVTINVNRLTKLCQRILTELETPDGDWFSVLKGSAPLIHKLAARLGIEDAPVEMVNYMHPSEAKECSECSSISNTPRDWCNYDAHDDETICVQGFMVCEPDDYWGTWHFAWNAVTKATPDAELVGHGPLGDRAKTWEIRERLADGMRKWIEYLPSLTGADGERTVGEAKQVPAADHKPDADKRQSLTCLEVRERLERLYDAGEPYTSQRDYAGRFECSAALVNEAIKGSQKLTAWKEAALKGKRKPRAQSLNEVIADTKPDARAADPSDVLLDDSNDALLAKLLDDATPEERARINAMSDAERRELGDAYREQARELNAESGRENKLLGRKA